MNVEAVCETQVRKLCHLYFSQVHRDTVQREVEHPESSVGRL